MATSFDPDDLDSFLTGIQALADEVGAKSTKTIKCFFCHKSVEVPLAYKLQATCPPCFQIMRNTQLKRPL